MKKATSSSTVKLALLRVGRNLGQQELATASGVHIRRIQQIESGDVKMENMSLKNALKLADALSVHPRELLE